MPFNVTGIIFKFMFIKETTEAKFIITARFRCITSQLSNINMYATSTQNEKAENLIKRQFQNPPTGSRRGFVYDGSQRQDSNFPRLSNGYLKFREIRKNTLAPSYPVSTNKPERVQHTQDTYYI